MAITDDVITATSQLTVTGGAGGPVFSDFVPLAGKAYVMGRLGVGAINPQNALDVEGAMAVGAGYAGSLVAPVNGLAVEGSVGVGTHSPGAKLDVAGTLKVSGNAHFLGRIGIGVATPLNALDVEGAVAVGAGYSGGVAAPVNGLAVEGSVGVGTHSPGAKLDVAGTLKVSGNAHFLGRIGIGVATPQNALDVEGALAVGAAYSGTTAAPANGMVVQGNVGVGTPTPSTRLHIAGTSPSLRIADGSQGDGKLLVSDASGNAVWRDNSRYFVSGNLNNAAITATTTPQKMGDYLTFAKTMAASSIEVHVNTRVSSGDLNGSIGVGFEVRIDDVASATGNRGAVTTRNTTEFISMFAVFQGLAAGSHTVSIWVHTSGGQSAGVVLDPGNWRGRIVVKETF